MSTALGLVRCAYGHLDTDEVEVVACDALPTVAVRIDGQAVAVCDEHEDRALLLARLVSADVADYVFTETADSTTLSCPPNDGHPGTVLWTLAGGNACPVCGRFA
jgi:hypothetical protein